MIVIKQTIRRSLNKIFPAWLIEPDPMSEVPKGMKLSFAFDKMVKVGNLKNIRRINNDIKQDHFERSAGMIQGELGYWRLSSHILVLLAAIAGGVYLKTLLSKETVVEESVDDIAPVIET